MKTKYIFSGLLALTLVSSCSEKMDYKEYNVYDKAYVDKMFSRVGGLMTNIYNDIDWDTHSPSSAYRFFVILRHHQQIAKNYGKRY